MRNTYSTGTVTVSAGSAEVIGNGTGWDPDVIFEGDMFLLAGYVIQIASVGSGNQITLGRTWPGTSAAGQLYDIAFVRASDRLYPRLIEMMGDVKNLTNAVQTTVQDLTAEAKAQALSNLGATALGATLFTLADKGAGRESLGLGTADVKNIGTSGDAVPLLNAANTWSHDQAFAGFTSIKAGALAGESISNVRVILGGVGAPTYEPRGAYMDIGYWANVGNDDGGYLFAGGWNRSATYRFSSGGVATALNGAWQAASDARLKPDWAVISDPIEKLRLLHGGTFHLDGSDQLQAGLRAQDAETAIPGITRVIQTERTLRSGDVIEDVLSLDTAGIAAAILVEATKVAFDRIEALEARIALLTPTQS